MSGIKTLHSSPAKAAYAAMDAPMFPVDASATLCFLNSSAFVISSEEPLSLKEPVGFPASYFISRRPVFESLLFSSNGVDPSPIEMHFERSFTGMNAQYFQCVGGVRINSSRRITFLIDP